MQTQTKSTVTDRLARKACAALILAIIVASSCVSGVAHAQGVPTAQILDTSPTSISRTKDSLAQWAKSFTLDRLATIAAKQILHQMTVATVNWINSGFKGSPAFITDPQGFFLDVADQVTGKMLSSSGPLKALCSPWSVDVRLSLAIEQAGVGNTRYSCTLGKIIGNAQGASLDGFMNGDFSQGGWPAFISMTTEQENNPIGSYLKTSADLNLAIGTRKSSLSLDLAASGGFLSWQDCQDVVVTNDEGFEESRQECTTKTPGSSIASMLHTSLNSPIIEAELANDINSVVSALVSQMISMTLQKGLYTLSNSPRSSAGPSYLTQLYAESASAQTVSTNGFSNQLNVDQVILENYENAAGLLDDSNAKLATASACYQNKVSSNALSPTQVSYAQSQIALIAATTTVLQAQISSIASKRETAAANVLKNSAADEPVTLGGSTDPNELNQNVAQLTKDYQDKANQAANRLSSDNGNTNASAADLAAIGALTRRFDAASSAWQSDCESLP